MLPSPHSPRLIMGQRKNTHEQHTELHHLHVQKHTQTTKRLLSRMVPCSTSPHSFHARYWLPWQLAVCACQCWRCVGNVKRGWWATNTRAQMWGTNADMHTQINLWRREKCRISTFPVLTRRALLWPDGKTDDRTTLSSQDVPGPLNLFNLLSKINLKY